MDFFAISGATAHKVYRLDIEQTLQNRMKALFLQQAEALLDSGLEIIPFEGGNFTPDDSEVLEIAPFDLPAEVYDSLQNIVGCESLPSNEDIIGGIFCVFGYEAESETLIFQVIQKQQRLSTASAWALFLSSDTFKRLEDPGLILSNACHAVYQGGSLKFKSMWWVKQIFDLSNFYKAATDADVDRFADHDALLVDDVEALKRNTGQWARTRIAFILSSGILDGYAPERLLAEATRFNVPLSLEDIGGNKKLRIPTERRELRAVLKFLEEELYVGVITGDTYEANSKRKRTEVIA